MGSLSAIGELLKYPVVRRDKPVVDDYHGVKIADPYRWQLNARIRSAKLYFLVQF